MSDSAPTRRRRIDVFAHVLLPRFYQRMLEIEPTIPQRYAFFNNPVLQHIEDRRANWDGVTKQVVSYVNALPEDFVGPAEAARLCRDANEELLEAVRENPDLFESAVLMVPMNNIDEACAIVHEQVVGNREAVGIQLFTRALGLPLSDPAFRPLFETLSETKTPAWLHPVFDSRKPDNNITFSWEYELTLAQLQLVEAGYLSDLDDLRVVVHHAGGMVPFFAGRVDHILPAQQAADFRKFYVDTAILGNPKALELAVDYYGADHVLFGTDAPLGIMPAGATAEILAAIDEADLTPAERDGLLYGNYLKLVDQI